MPFWTGTNRQKCLVIAWRSLTSLSIFIRNVVELLIEEYQNAEKSDFIDWNTNENFNHEDDTNN